MKRHCSCVATSAPNVRRSHINNKFHNSFQRIGRKSQRRDVFHPHMPAMFQRCNRSCRNALNLKVHPGTWYPPGTDWASASITLLSTSSPWCWWLNVKTWQPDPRRVAACTLLHNTWTPSSPTPFHTGSSPTFSPRWCLLLNTNSGLQPMTFYVSRLFSSFRPSVFVFPRVRAVASRGRSAQPTEDCSLWAWQANCQGRSRSLYKASASAWKEKKKKKSPQASADMLSISHDGLNASPLNGCLNSAGFQSCSVTRMSSEERAAFMVHDRSSQIPRV